MTRKHTPSSIPPELIPPWEELHTLLRRIPDISYDELQLLSPSLDLAPLWLPLYDEMNVIDASGSSPMLNGDFDIALAAAKQIEEIEKAPHMLALSEADSSTVLQLAKVEFETSCADKPAGFRLLVTYHASLTTQEHLAREHIPKAFAGLVLSSANMPAPKDYTIPVDPISRNLALLEPDANEIYVGKTSEKGKRRNVTVVATMDFPMVKVGGGYLTNYDKAILNGVSSLLLSGTRYFTLPMLYAAFSGKENPSLDRTAIDALRQRLEFMRHSSITIDYTDEVAARMVEGAVDNFSISTYVLPMSKIEARLNGRVVEAYHLLDTPPLFAYARMKRQLSVVPRELLDVPLNNNASIVTMKNYILTRIEGMKNPHNRLSSNKILYASIFEELGEEAPTKLRRKRIRDYTSVILDHLVDKQYIAGYEQTTAGRTIDGVLIHLKDRSVVYAADIPLQETAASSRIKPTTSKKRKKIPHNPNQ